MAVGYLKSGLQGVIASDDPGVYGYLDLSYDFFEAAMSFGLDLPAFKKLAQNSFNYSALDAASVASGLALWQKKWDTFVTGAAADACKPNGPVLSYPNRPEFEFLFPNMGPLNQATMVEVAGSYFQVCVN
jgi:hypothetical protein